MSSDDAPKMQKGLCKTMLSWNMYMQSVVTVHKTLSKIIYFGHLLVQEKTEFELFVYQKSESFKKEWGWHVYSTPH